MLLSPFQAYMEARSGGHDIFDLSKLPLHLLILESMLKWTMLLCLHLREHKISLAVLFSFLYISFGNQVQIIVGHVICIFCVWNVLDCGMIWLWHTIPEIAWACPRGFRLLSHCELWGYVLFDLFFSCFHVAQPSFGCCILSRVVLHKQPNVLVEMSRIFLSLITQLKTTIWATSNLVFFWSKSRPFLRLFTRGFLAHQARVYIN